MQKIDGLNILKFESVAEVGRYALENKIHADEDSEHEKWAGGVKASKVAQLCIDGDHSKVSSAEKLLDFINCEIETLTFEDAPCVAGFYPCVPDAINGEIECMRSPELVRNEFSPVHIVVNLSSSMSIDSAALERRGVAILALAMALSASRPIRLSVCMTGDGSNSEHSGEDRFSIVSADIDLQNVDISSACHALTSTGFARQLLYGIARQACGFSGSWPRFKKIEKFSSAYDKKISSYLGDNIDDVVYIKAPTNTDTEFSDPVNWVKTRIAMFSAQ